MTAQQPGEKVVESEIDLMPQPGPCCICGATNYPLSFGGPTVCPSCDCGNFTSATVVRQAKIIADLRSALEGKEREWDAAINLVRVGLATIPSETPGDLPSPRTGAAVIGDVRRLLDRLFGSAKDRAKGLEILSWQEWTDAARTVPGSPAPNPTSNEEAVVNEISRRSVREQALEEAKDAARKESEENNWATHEDVQRCSPTSLMARCIIDRIGTLSTTHIEKPDPIEALRKAQSLLLTDNDPPSLVAIEGVEPEDVIEAYEAITMALSSPSKEGE